MAEPTTDVARCVWCRRLCVVTGTRGECSASPICAQRPLAERLADEDNTPAREHRPNGCCDYHRHVADGCCHCDQEATDD